MWNGDRGPSSTNSFQKSLVVCSVWILPLMPGMGRGSRDTEEWQMKVEEIWTKARKAGYPVTAHWRQPTWSRSWIPRYKRTAQKNCISWSKGQQRQSWGGILLLSSQWKAQRWRQTLLRGTPLLNKRPQVWVATLKTPFKHLENFPHCNGGQTLEQNPETLKRNLQRWRSSKLYWIRPWAILAGPALGRVLTWRPPEPPSNLYESMNPCF